MQYIQVNILEPCTENISKDTTYPPLDKGEETLQRNNFKEMALKKWFKYQNYQDASRFLQAKVYMYVYMNIHVTFNSTTQFYFLYVFWL